METNQETPSPPRLELVLGKLRHRIRRVLGSRGALITAVTALAALLVLVAVDFRFSPLPQGVRWTLTVAWVAAVIAAAVVWWWLPLRRPLNLVRIARWLETRHPDIDERVSTVLEVSGHDDRGMSRELMNELAREAAADLAAIDPRIEVSMRRARRWLWPAAGLFVLWCGLFVAWPQWTARHVVRALVPGSTLGNAAGSIIVEPGSVELIEGDPLRVTARYEGGTPKPLEIVLHLADGSTFAEQLQENDGTFVYQLGRADRGFEYEIRAGRETSDRFRVTVWPQPRLVDPRVRLEYPAYTGLAPREQAVGDGISAVAGTQAELRARLNTPVESARFEIDATEAGSTTLERSAAGGALASRWLLAAPGRGEARLVLKHRLGREFEALRFAVETLADAPPLVKWISPTQKELRLRPDELLEMVYQASDDIGLGSVRMEVEPNNGKAGTLPQDMPVRIGRAEPPAWRGEIRQAIGALRERWPQANQYKLRMRVEDSRPPDLGGPGLGVSSWITVRIEDNAEPLARQEVFAEHSDARETIEEARQLVQKARERIDARRNELRQGEMKEPVRKEMAEARENLAAAREKLEELAERMQESVHAAKADDVTQVAAIVEKAREQLEETPLQDTEPARDKMAEQARQSAEQAERKLEQLRDEIQRAEPQVQDFARLKELEQQQRELARQAEQALAENNKDQADPANKSDQSEQTPPLPQAWQQRQDQVAEALRQQTEQKPQARAEALAEQAEQARELAAEAREQAASQQSMKDLAQENAAADQAQAQPKEGSPQAQPPKPDSAAAQELREQLSQEQAAIRDEVKEQLAEARQRQDQATANVLPEAAQSTEAAASALEKQDDAAAAKEANQAAQELAQAAEVAQQGEPQGESQGEKQGESPAQTQGEQPGQPQGSPSPEAAQAAAELGNLAERQEQVAEALKALDSGELDAARKQLGEMRAEATAELAEEIREAPQVSPSGAMQQAAQEANQAAQQASQAAQQASPANAASQHGESAAQLQQAATHLDQAAEEFARQAAEAAGQKPNDQQAPVPGQSLAEAFQQASQAADANSQAAAANHAQSAAEALAQAARGAKRAMQGNAPPQGQQPGQAQGQSQQPGTKPDETARNRQPDPGVPPELAKLGISAEDWEKIKSSLKAEIGGSSAIAMPEEYRDLVRRYFEQMAKGGGQ